MNTPLLRRIVPFYGDEIVAVQQGDGTIYVLFARLCDNLGVARNRQAERIQEHSVLSEGFVQLVIETDGGPQESQCLRLDLLPLWLISIQAKRTKPKVQERLIRYQREATAVLWEAFKPQIIQDEAPLTTESGLAISQLEQIVEQSRAMQRMDVAWTQFISLTIGKAAEAGRTVILVDPRNTSKMCSQCGELVVKDLGERTHECPHCGLVLDPDVNAAINILHREVKRFRPDSVGWGGILVKPRRLRLGAVTPNSIAASMYPATSFFDVSSSTV